MTDKKDVAKPVRANPVASVRGTLGHLSAWSEIITDKEEGYLRYGKNEVSRTFGINKFVLGHLVKGGLVPAAFSVLEINKDLVNPLVRAVRRQQKLGEGVTEVRQRFAAAGRYGRLIDELGRKLFGSAVFDGEVKLGENAFYRLSYLPPAEVEGPPKPALFHVGGFLPFSDRIFRLLPEANLFKPLLERGYPIYAMELKGDREVLPNASGVTLERVIDTIDEMTGIAFRHNGGRKMVLEGYCGLAMPSLSFIAARPKQAEARIGMAMVMVAPIDGRRCKMLADMVTKVPDYLLFSRYIFSELLSGYVSGKQLRAGIDIPLDTFFVKTGMGRFITGWKRRKFHSVEQVADLSPGQRKELAGAYWISPENCDRFTLPVDLVRFSTELWRRGVADDGAIPASYKGQKLSFETIARETTMPLLGIYGGQDKVIPDDTAHILQELFGERYTHVVHPAAGHVSYVFSDEIWAKGHPYALDPNPLDLIDQLYRS